MNNKQVRTLIVDDEALARKGLAVRLLDYPELQLVGQATSGLEALKLIKEQEPDVVFLDIQMPGLTGIEVIEKLKGNIYPLPQIVFVTAYDEYAVKAFELHAIDYLLKPVDDHRLAETVEKIVRSHSQVSQNEREQKLINVVAELTGNKPHQVAEKVANNLPIESSRFPDYIAIKDGHETFRVNTSDIRYVDAAGDYMVIHTGNENHVMRKTMKELEQELDPERFVRVHRSVIVNISCIQKMVSQLSGEYQIVLDDETPLKVSRSHRDKVKQVLTKS